MILRETYPRVFVIELERRAMSGIFFAPNDSFWLRVTRRP
jgi:hypothetical protein